MGVLVCWRAAYVDKTPREEKVVAYFPKIQGQVATIAR